MVFLEVPDKAVDDVFTEGMWDSFIRDNLNKGVTRPLAETDISVAGTIDWQSIPADHSHLMILAHLRGDNASVDRVAQFTFNNDSGANYFGESITAQHTTLAAASLLSQGAGKVGAMPGASATANHFATFLMLITDYPGSAYKAVTVLGGDSTGTGTTGQNAEMNGVIWRSTSAINRIILKTDVGNLAVGSKATLYGFGGI